MSQKTGIIVQARMSSSRLPGKSLIKIGPHPLIWYVVRRLQLLELPVIVCTSVAKSDDDLAHFLIKENISVYRGDLQNVLKRYINAAEAHNISQIVRITGDNPLVDIEYLFKSLNLFKNYSYVDGIYEGGLIKGSGFELVTIEELKGITSQENDHLEHVTAWLRDNLNKSSSRIELKPTLINKFKNEIYLTCDYKEDLILLRKIFKNFGYRVDISLEEILRYLNENSSLKDLNSFRHNQN